MKTSTVFSCALLLLILLAVYCSNGAPLQTAQDEEDMRDELEAFFEQNPSIANTLFPDFIEEASDVTVTMDQDSVVDLLNTYVKKATVEEIEKELEKEEDSEEGEDEVHTRRKRQTSVIGSIQSSRNSLGRSIGGSAGLNHSWNNGRHTLSGTIGGTRHTINGKGSANSYNGGVAYNFSPNKKTSFGINAHKSMTPGGSSHGFAVSFSHKFGR